MEDIRSQIIVGNKTPRYDCVIPCGGEGTRIRALTKDQIAKCLLRVDGKELIKYSIELLDPAIIDRLIFAVDKHEMQVRRWVESVSLPYAFGFSNQDAPGLLYAVKSAIKESDKETVLICHADVIRPGIQLLDAFEFHERCGAMATVIGTYADKLFQRWIINFDTASQNVLGFGVHQDEFIKRPEDRDLVLTGALILNKEAMNYANPKISNDYLGIVQPLIDAHKLKVYISQSLALFDVGTPEEFKEAQAYFEELRRK